MQDNLHNKEAARDGLIRGIRRCAEVVGSTMGTAGYNSIIEAIEAPQFFSTNDGWTILNAIKFADPMEELGSKILVEAVARANKNSGDGSSTTCVLTAAIIEEGLKYVDKYAPMVIKRSLEGCIPLVEKAVLDQKHNVELNEVGAVATISAEDAEIGAKIQEIYEQIGKDGLIYWEASKTPEDHYTIGRGITINGAGYRSQYMCDVEEASGRFTGVASLKDAPILIVKEKITSGTQFNKLFDAMYGQGLRDLVLFYDESEPQFITEMVATRAKTKFRVILVKMPVIYGQEWFEDLAAVSNATAIDPAQGVWLKDVNTAHLGKVGNIVITKDDTYIDGLNPELVELHVKHLASDDSDAGKARVARLNTKTARYFVGAHSESALAYRRLKVEDAISAAYHALQGGVVPGGGIALLNAAKSMGVSDVGQEILFNALRAPMMRIINNVATNPAFLDRLGGKMGYDTRTSTVVDMLEAKIIDPVPIILNAVKNSISVATSVLTANAVVLLPKEQPTIPSPYVGL